MIDKCFMAQVITLKTKFLETHIRYGTSPCAMWVVTSGAHENYPNLSR